MVWKVPGGVGDASSGLRCEDSALRQKQIPAALGMTDFCSGNSKAKQGLRFAQDDDADKQLQEAEAEAEAKAKAEALSVR